MSIEVMAANIAKIEVSSGVPVVNDECRVVFDDTSVWLKWDQLEELNQKIVDALNEHHPLPRSQPYGVRDKGLGVVKKSRPRSGGLPGGW